MSPVHSTTVRYGRPSVCSTCSASAVSASSSSYDVLGRRELHELDLVELVLADQPAHVRAVRAGFAAEARRVGGVLQRQEPAVEDLAAIQIRHRHLGRRDQVEIPLARDLEQVRLELRQLTGAVQRRPTTPGTAAALRCSRAACVCSVQHEVDERALELRAGPHQHREPRARDLRRALEVDDAELRARDPSAPCGSKSNARGSPQVRTTALSAADFPTGTLACGRFGSVSSSRHALPLDAVELDFELLDLLRRAACWLRRCATRLRPAAWRARPRRRRCSARA